MTLDIEAEIRTRIAAMEAEPHASSDPDRVRREILVVEDHVHTTAAEAGSQLRSLTQIELMGLPSPSSEVVRGIIVSLPPIQYCWLGGSSTRRRNKRLSSTLKEGLAALSSA